MRLVSYRSARGPRAGVLSGKRITDAWDVLGEPERSSLRELLAEDRIGELAQIELDEAGELLADAELLPPIPDPDKIICIGLNHRSHAEETGLDPPKSPTFFAKFRNALAPPGATVHLPANSEKVDYEAELAFVVGRRAKDVAVEEAPEFIAGYTLFNDLSARDLQFATPQWMPGKVFDGSAPCGPALVTPDEAGPADAIEIALDLNGERMQAASTAELIFPVAALVSHLSGLMTLGPGDIVATGTPAGVGSVRRPRVWLRDGDRLVVSSPKLGRLETRVARAPAA
jgi:2-keto-4-pentenoate hydratase/2-oxohepta-3-ene-1,7-dioic acid hydratase in catechol pathway